MKKYIFLVIALFTLSLTSQAQHFIIADDIKLGFPEDYKTHEDLTYEITKFLIDTPIDKYPQDRANVSKFMFEWISGCPYMDIVIYDKLMPLDNGPLTMVFIAGWIKYSIENSYTNDVKKCALAAIKTMNAFYLENEVYLDSKFVKKMIKLEKKGKLEKYVSKQVDKMQK